MTIVQPIQTSRIETTAPAPRVNAASDVDFTKALSQARELPASPAPLSRGSRSGELEPLQKFEGFVLRTFVEAMLPKNATAVFGEGTAGDIWRSMMAEKIGEEIAASGGIGIAALLEKDNAAKVAAGADALADEAARATGSSASTVR